MNTEQTSENIFKYVRKPFRKFLKNSGETVVLKFLLKKLEDWKSPTLLKKDCGLGFSPWNLRQFPEHLRNRCFWNFCYTGHSNLCLSCLNGCRTKIKVSKKERMQVWTNWFSRPGKTPEMRPIFRAHTFCLVKNEKLFVNSKYYHEYERTCNILIKLIHLMASKLLYLLMSWETFNQLPALEQVKIKTIFGENS